MGLFDIAGQEAAGTPDLGPRQPLAFDTLPPVPTNGRPAFDPAFDAAAKEYGVDPDVLRGVAFAESRFRPDVIDGRVKSSTGAAGLMQFMPDTAKEHGINPLDPVEAIFGAAAYLRKSLDHFGGDVEKAVASYNAGRNRYAFKAEDWKPRMPKETQGYLDAVLSFAEGQKAKRGPQQELPEGVTPSTAGAGRGGVNPPAVQPRPDAPLADQFADMTYDAMGNPTGGAMTAGGSLPAVDRFMATEQAGLAARAAAQRQAERDRSNAATAANVTANTTGLSPAELALQQQAARANAAHNSGAGAVADAIGAAPNFARDAGIGLVKGAVGTAVKLPLALQGVALDATGTRKAAESVGLRNRDALTAINDLDNWLSSLKSNAGKVRDAKFSATRGLADTMLELGANPAMIADKVAESMVGTVAIGGLSGLAVKSAMPRLTEAAKGLGLTGQAAEDFIAKGAARVAQIAAPSTEGAQSTLDMAGDAQQAGRTIGQYGLPALAAGVGTAAIGYGANKVGAKAGIGDIETDIALRGTGIQTAKSTAASRAERILMEGTKEGAVEEGPQSLQEAAFQNIAMGRPWDEGLGKQTATGLVTGFGMGGAHASVTSHVEAPRVEDQPTVLVVPKVTPKAVESDATPAAEPNLATTEQQSLSQRAAALVQPEASNVSTPVASDAAIQPGAGSGSAVDAGSVGAGGLVDGNAGRDVSGAAAGVAGGSGPVRVLAYGGGEQAPVAVRNESGTVTIKGEPQALIQMLRNAGVTSILPASNGVVVGKSQAERAEQVVADFSQRPNPLRSARESHNSGAAVALPPFQREEDAAQAPLKSEATDTSTALDRAVQTSKDVVAAPVSEDTVAPAETAKSDKTRSTQRSADANADQNRLFTRADRGTTDPMASRKDVVGNSQGGRSADDETPGAVAKLQSQLARIEAKYDPLRKQKKTGGPEWDEVENEASAVRRQLFDLTGDPYGKPKVKVLRPSNEALEASYLSPDDIPADVRRWVQQHANTLTSDATDAVRWGRIADTLRDDRYPSGDLVIYRAVADGDGIRAGDWVTTDRKYAEMHLARHLNGKGHILEETVDGRDVLTSPTGNAEEAIYAPRELSGPVSNESPAPNSDGASLFTRTAQTELPSFKKWFGDSKVVDADGNPLVVYHGSTADIDTFMSKHERFNQEDGNRGIYFSSDPGYAGMYASKRDYRAGANDHTGGNVSAVFLSIKNPKVIESREDITFDEKYQSAYVSADAVKDLKAQGYDGIINHAANEFVVFEPTQIKSAIGNRGSFDPNDASILASTGVSRPFAAYRDLQGMGGSPDRARTDAERILGVKSPVPVMRKADQKLAEERVPMYYDLDSKTIIYNTAFKNRSRADDAQWMAEEILHAIDHIDERRTISVGSGMLKPGGEIRQEIEAATKRSGTIRAFLQYPLEFNFSEDRKSAELFARIGVIFRGFPEMLRVAAPKTYEVYREIFADSVPGEVRGRDAGADRQTDQRPDGLGQSGPETGGGNQGRPSDQQLAGFRQRASRALGSTAEGAVGDFGRLEARAGPNNTFDLPEFGRIAQTIEKVQNRYNRWKQTLDAVKEQGGLVDDTNDFYAAEERYWGIVGNQADEFADEVKQFVKDVRKDDLTLDQVAEYAYALHAPERNAQIAKINPKFPDGGSGMLDQEAQDIIDAARNNGTQAALDRHAATLQQWTSGTRDVLESNGLISPAERAAWEAPYQHYVPLRGSPIEKEKKGAKGTGQGFDVRGKESTRALGRRSQAEHIIENIVQDRTRALVRAGKNEVLRRFTKFVLDNPDPSLWEINAVENKRTLSTDANGDQLVTDHLAVDKLPEHTVAVKDGGDTIYIRVYDDTLLEQLKNLNRDEIGHLTGAMLWANRQLSRMYTSLSPTFALFTNPVRDFTAGTINMVGARGFKAAGKFAAGVPMAWGPAVMAEIAGKPSRMYREFQLTGGQTGFLDYRDVDQQVKELRRLVNQADITWNPATWVSGHGWKTPFIAGTKAMSTLLGGIETVTGVMENATRFAAYKMARESGESPTQAASLAKNLTVNFNRKGTMTSGLSAFFLFFNPAVQGSARMLEALKNPKVMATLGVAMTGVALLALSNAGAGDDDDGVAWWDKIPDYEKERNLIFVLSPESKEGEKIPGTKTGRYLKIPMPYGYNVFAVMANNAVDVMRNQADPKRGKTAGKAALGVGKAFLGSWVPANDIGTSFENQSAIGLVGVPSVFDPIAQNMLNVNGMGRKLYRNDAQAENLPDSENYGLAQRGTVGQKIAKGLNSATGGSKFREGAISVTPASVNNALRGYGGAPVGFAMDMANVFLRNGIERDSPEWYRAPFAKQVYGQVDSAIDQGIAYDRIHEIGKKDSAKKRAEEAGDKRELGMILAAEGPLTLLGKAAQETQKALSEIRKDEMKIIDDPKMGDTQKTLRLRQLDLKARQASQGLARAVNRQIDSRENTEATAERLLKEAAAQGR